MFLGELNFISDPCLNTACMAGLSVQMLHPLCNGPGQIETETDKGAHMGPICPKEANYSQKDFFFLRFMLICEGVVIFR